MSIKDKLTLQEQCEIIAGYPPKYKCTKDQDCEIHMGDCSLDDLATALDPRLGCVEDWLDDVDVEIVFADPKKKLTVLSAYMNDGVLTIDVEEKSDEEVDDTNANADWIPPSSIGGDIYSKVDAPEPVRGPDTPVRTRP